MTVLNEKNLARADESLRELERFFRGEDAVHRALHAIVRRLDAIGVPYAVVGGMALNAHGYKRATVDVDLLTTPESIPIIHEQLEGPGYLSPFAGSRHLRDTENNVKIEFLITGGYPGDGKPKAISFPDPQDVFVEIKGIRYINLETLIELKLASGMTNVNRLKDISDIQELIRVVKPPRELGEKLNAFVRDKYFELWDNLQLDSGLDQNRE